MSENDKEYKVFVSYYHSREGFGNLVLEINYKINSNESVRRVEDFLVERYGFRNVKIINWKVLGRVDTNG